jgi:hypothetical protein
MFKVKGTHPLPFPTQNFKCFVFCRYYKASNAPYTLSPFLELKSDFLFTKNWQKKTDLSIGK